MNRFMDKRYALVLIILSVVFISSYAQNGSGEKFFEPYTENADVEVILKGASAGNAFLFGVYGDQNLLRDSAQADSSGRVIFTNKRYPEGLYYVAYKDNSNLWFLLDRNQEIFLH